MHKVEVIWLVRPVFLDIVDLEERVAWREGRLRWGKVYTGHIGIRELVGHIDSPNTSSRAYVQDSTVVPVQLLIWNRRSVQLVVQKQRELMVLKIIAIHFLLVNGHAIFMSAMSWIYSSSHFDTPAYLAQYRRQEGTCVGVGVALISGSAWQVIAQDRVPRLIQHTCSTLHRWMYRYLLVPELGL